MPADIAVISRITYLLFSVLRAAIIVDVDVHVRAPVAARVR
jgi:hypothetical protein